MKRTPLALKVICGVWICGFCIATYLTCASPTTPREKRQAPNAGRVVITSSSLWTQVDHHPLVVFTVKDTVSGAEYLVVQTTDGVAMAPLPEHSP